MVLPPQELKVKRADIEKAEKMHPPILFVDNPLEEYLAHPGQPLEERKVNLEYLTAVDSALRRSNNFGLSAFLPARTVGGLPLGAKRYFVLQECNISGKARHRELQLI